MSQLKEVEKARKTVVACGIVEYGSDEHVASWRKFDEILDKQKDGIYEGRLFTYGVADGAAMYYISKINTKSVRLTHIPEYVDGYMQHGLYEGKTIGIAKITSEAKATDRFNSHFKR